MTKNVESSIASESEMEITDEELARSMGNEKLHILTSRRPYMARFDFVDLSNEKAYATYCEFSVQNESSNYRLHISGYEGTAGDSMMDYRWNSLNGRMFTTKDRDNDIRDGDNSATKFTRSSFWHGNGLNGNINGLYQSGGNKLAWRIMEMDIYCRK
ncbi:unnamed protein product [Mytilus coruscus]|uniref:Fibrinogen C-terminal domain-containing protein n=1 Tax=Mytilus coruscus TaxID=42192 RepID=A0A6J8E5S7_MYTCO|nr:unnamed protein product [Mytilus coruscus]